MADGHSNTLLNRRSVARAGLLLLGPLQQGESFDVFKKKEIRLIVFVLNTTNIRFSFTFRMKTETVGQQSRWIEPQGSGPIAQRRRQLDAAMAACEQLYI